MTIARYENTTINEITNGKDTYGQYTSTSTPLFTSRATVADVANSLRISDKYRVYSDLVNLKFNYTPFMKRVVDDQNKYSVTWRGFEWRITDVREDNSRQHITLLCYRNDPNTAA